MSPLARLATAVSMGLLLASTAMACASSGARRRSGRPAVGGPAEADAAPHEGEGSPDAAAPDAGAAAADPEEAPGEEGCGADDDCVLTTWVCAPCRPCPGSVRARAVLRRTARAARYECAHSRPGAPPTAECPPCPAMPPGFRDWTDVSCRDGRCVARRLDPEPGRARWAPVSCDQPPPSGEPPRGALSLFDARRGAEGQPMWVVAYLLQHTEPCPPCPEGAACEACLPEHPLVGDIPPRGEVGERASSAWVDEGLSGAGLDALPVGQRVLLCGEWSEGFETFADLLFTLHRMTVLPEPGDPGP